jgi:hypothetical protein
MLSVVDQAEGHILMNNVVPIIGNRLEFVGVLRIYVNPQGELVIPIGNCRVFVEDEQARAFLDDLLALAGKFRQFQAATSNGHVPVLRH